MEGLVNLYSSKELKIVVLELVFYDHGLRSILILMAHLSKYYHYSSPEIMGSRL